MMLKKAVSRIALVGWMLIVWSSVAFIVVVRSELNATRREFGMSPVAFSQVFASSYRAVMFGGLSSSGTATAFLFVSTAKITPSLDPYAWVNDSTAWFRSVVTANAPVARSSGQLDAIAGSPLKALLLFGGIDVSGNYLSDIHVYLEVGKWYSVAYPATIAPYPMARFAMCGCKKYVQTTNLYTAYFFFGLSPTDGMLSAVRVMQLARAPSTGEFTLVSFGAIPTSTSSSAGGDGPSARVSACCAFSENQNATVCFGGFDGITALNDTWVFWHTTSTWTLVAQNVSSMSSVPSGRFDSGCVNVAVAAPSAERFFLHGGFVDASMKAIQDPNIYCWEWATQRWSICKAAANCQDVPCRGGAALTAQVVTEQVVPPPLLYEYGPTTLQIFGGLDENGATMGDRWFIVMNKNVTISDTALMTKYESSVPVPEARSGHSMAALGSGFVVAFGRGDTTYANAYYYQLVKDGDVSSNSMWLTVDVSASIAIPSARYDAASCVKGLALYAYGGVSGRDGSYRNDLWSLTFSFDINGTAIKASWTLLSSSNLLDPNGRAQGGMAVRGHQLYVVGGSSPTGSGASLVCFDMVRYEWRTVTVAPPSQRSTSVPYLPLIVSGTVHRDEMNNLVYLFGGWEISGADGRALPQSSVYRLNFSDAAVAIDRLSLTTPFFRSRGAVTGTGNRMLVCGGVVLVIPAPTVARATEQCMWLIMPPVDGPQATVVQVTPSRLSYPVVDTADNTKTTMVHGATVDGGAVIVGKTFFYLGGLPTANGAVMANVVSNNLLQVSLPLCSSTPAAAACLSVCAPGAFATTAGECEFVPTGTYWTPRAITGALCQAGAFLPTRGASKAESCVFCPSGTYAPRQGSAACLPCPQAATCPVACSVPRTPSGGGSEANNTSNAADQTPISTQPAPVEKGTTPPVLMSAAGGITAFMTVLLLILGWCASRLRRRVIKHYIDEESVVLLRTLYETHRHQHMGLNVNGLQKVLGELDVKVHDEHAARLLAAEDEDGTGFVTFSQFKSLVVQLIRMELLSPFTTSDEASLKNGGGLNRLQLWIADFRLASLDGYEKEHQLFQEGDPIRLVKTRTGGIARLLFIVIAVAALIVLFGQFFYENVTETRSTVPSVTFDDRFLISTLTVDVGVSGGSNSYAACMLEEGGGSLSWNNENETESLSFGPCAPEASITSSYFTNVSVSCAFDNSTGGCIMRAVCHQQCSFSPGGNTTFDFRFGPDVFASTITIAVSATTGILGTSTNVVNFNSDTELVSSVTTDAHAPSNVVFRGFPATVASF